MSKKEMFIKITGGHSILGVSIVQKAFPCCDLSRIHSLGSGQFMLFRCRWTLCTLGQPAGNKLELFFFQGGKTKGHSAVGMLREIAVQFNGALGAGQVIGLGVVFSCRFWIFHLMIQNLKHK